MIINMTGGGAAKPNLTSIRVTTAPTTTAYNVGDSFDTTGMEVTAYFDDGSSEVVMGYTYSPTSALTMSTKTITVSYTYDGVTKTTTVSLTINYIMYQYGSVGSIGDFTLYEATSSSSRGVFEESSSRGGLYMRSYNNKSDSISHLNKLAFFTSAKSLTGVNTIYFDARPYVDWGSANGYVYFFISSTKPTSYSIPSSAVKLFPSSSTRADYALDVSSLSGDYYIGFATDVDADDNTALDFYVTVYKIYGK